MKQYTLVKASIIRALYAAAETAIGIIGSKTLLGEIDWRFVASAVALSTIVSLLKSIVIGTPESGGIND